MNGNFIVVSCYIGTAPVHINDWGHIHTKMSDQQRCADCQNIYRYEKYTKALTKWEKNELHFLQLEKKKKRK